MTSTAPAAPTVQRRGTGRDPSQARRSHARDRHERSRREHRVLARYTDREGHPREVVAARGAAGSTLVIDRRSASRDDPRLVAHIAADEPVENAALVCRGYLQDAGAGGCRCRLVTAQDMSRPPFADPWEQRADTRPSAGRDVAPLERSGCGYALELLPSRMSIPELRWCRHGHASASLGEPVSMREAIAALESYEPIQELTLEALSRHGRDETISTAVLRAELARVQASPIVLNRALREAVLRAVHTERLSMSEIAIRCGRVKRDRRGNEAGETSWLARRVGLLPEGGHTVPTPWIHSDVLALIARRGLAISPREVEL
jgi:hypothetical protein